MPKLLSGFFFEAELTSDRGPCEVTVSPKICSVKSVTILPLGKGVRNGLSFVYFAVRTASCELIGAESA